MRQQLINAFLSGFRIEDYVPQMYACNNNAWESIKIYDDTKLKYELTQSQLADRDQTVL
jgi:hypothetical protein